MTTRALGALLVVVALAAGCGDDVPDSASDPGPASSSSSSSAGGGTVAPGGDPWQEVAIVSGTAAGGEVSSEPVLVDTQAALDAFVGQFERSDLADKVVEAVSGAAVPEGWVPVAAVISIGCDVPPGVYVRVLDGAAGAAGAQAVGLAVTAQKTVEPMRECFAAVTSVAVLVVDPAAL